MISYKLYAFYFIKIYSDINHKNQFDFLFLLRLYFNI